MREKIIEYETVEVEQEQVICDLCGHEAEEATTALFAPDIQKPLESDFRKKLRESTATFRSPGDRPGFGLRAKKAFREVRSEFGAEASAERDICASCCGTLDIEPHPEDEDIWVDIRSVDLDTYPWPMNFDPVAVVVGLWAGSFLTMVVYEDGIGYMIVLAMLFFIVMLCTLHDSRSE